MRCFTSLVLGLLALEVALAQNLQEQIFNSVPSMCSDISSSGDARCINCQTREECAQNAMCCSSSCGKTYKIPVKIGVSKAGSCPWNPFEMIIAGPCPKKNFCFSDSECSGNMKCCSVGCITKCTTPVPEISFQ